MNKQIGLGRSVRQLFACVMAVWCLFAVASFKVANSQSLTPEGETGIWRPTGGPLAGGVTDLLSDGSRLFAATHDSIFVSSDKGRSWTPSNNGLTDVGASDLKLGRSGSTLYAGGSRLYRSTDNGQNWKAVNAGLPENGSINSILTFGSGVFVLTRSPGIFASFDEGQSWALINTPLEAVQLMAVSGRTLIVSGYKGVFRSTDGGHVWTSASAGLPPNEIPNSLVVAGSNVFIGISSYAPPNSPPRVFVSSDQGANWIASGNGLNGAFVRQMFANGADIFAATEKGVFRSTDNGGNWIPANSGLSDSDSVIFAADAENLYLSGGDDVYVSANRGDSWRSLNVEFQITLPTVFAAVGETVFAAGYGGIFRYAGTGQNAKWARVNNGLPTHNIQSLAVAGTDVFCSTKVGVFRSSDQGQNWVAASNGLTDPNVVSIAARDTVIFAGTAAGGVFRSTNRGQSWAAVNEGLESKEVKILFVKGASLFAGTWKGLFRSDNDGGSWKAIAQGLTTIYGEPVNLITAMAASGSNMLLLGTHATRDNGIYSFTLPQLFRSYDNGESWQIHYLDDFREVNSITANGSIFIAGTESGIRFSSANSESWASANVGLPLSLYPPDGKATTGVASVFATRDRVFAATYSYGVYVRDQATFECSYRLSENEKRFAAESGSGMVEVRTGSSCPWTARSNAEWVKITAGEDSTGNGTVRFMVAANLSSQPRQATLTIAGETYQVTQAECAMISPTSQRFESLGGGGQISVTSAADCDWTATSPVSWVAIAAGASGKGNGAVRFNVVPNTTANSRRADLNIAGQKFVVLQSGVGGSCVGIGPLVNGQVIRGELATSDCLSEVDYGILGRRFADRYSVDGTKGQTIVVAVEADDYVPGIALLGPNGDLVSQTNEYPGNTSRLPHDGNLPLPATGKYTIEISSLYPRQTGRYRLSFSMPTPGCNYEISLTAQNFPASGGTATINVKAGANCTWRATGFDDWVSFTSAATGSGNGGVSYRVNANAGNGSRSAELVIAGERFGLSQERNSNPTLAVTSISPSSVPAGGPGFTLTVDGKGFRSDTKVVWKDHERPTTFVSNTQLKAEISAADIAGSDPYYGYVYVINPEPNGGSTDRVGFDIIPPNNQRLTQTAGPGGGSISAVYNSGSQLFAGTAYGDVYRSSDRGQSWQRVLKRASSGDYNLGRAAIRQFASTGNSICALGEGIFCSRDGGQTLDGFLRPDYGTSINAITAVGEEFLVGTSSGPMRIRLSDLSFQPITSPLNGKNVTAIAAAGQRVFAGTEVDGLFVSNNGGVTWTAINNDQEGFYQIRYILITPSKVFLAAQNGISISSDQGQTWRSLDSDSYPSSTVIGLATTGSTLFALSQSSTIESGAGLFRHSALFRLKEGGSWRQLSIESPASAMNAIASDGANLLVATSGAGIFHSTDDGQSWQRINRGLTATKVVGFAAVGSTLYAAAEGTGVFRSNDFGRSWIAVNNGFKNFHFTAIAANSSALFAATPEGIYRSTDEGHNWINTGVQSRLVSSIAFKGDTVFVGAINATDVPDGVGQAYRNYKGGFFISDNNGQSWRDVSSLMPTTSINALAVKGKNLYAGTDEGLLISTDNGLNWKPEREEIDLQSIQSLAVVGDTILVSGNEGVFRSTDDGQSWKLSQSGYYSLLTVSGTRVFALGDYYGFDGDKLFTSENRGETWVSVDNVGYQQFNALFTHQAWLFLGTHDSGAYVSDLAPNAITTVSAASFLGNELALGSIAVAFGTELTASLVGTEPTSVEAANTRILFKVRDSLEKEAKLFFVSPRQVNFLIPEDNILEGEATVTVITGDGKTSIGNVHIAQVAPGLFTANGNGQGVASGFVLRVRANGEQVYEPLSRFEPAQNRFVTAPIDLGPATDQLFLVLFGTGLRRNRGVSAKIGGASVQPLFAGAQGEFDGLDQINLRLPRILAGRGEVAIELTVEGKRSNTVTISIR